MSHETVLAALNKLSKKRAWETDPSRHAEHMLGENPRTSIILNGSTLEHLLAFELEGKMPHANSDELSRIFGPEGPLGTFANKTRIAQAMGIIDRATSKKIDVIRAMRNAAAHCVDPIGFGDKPFKDGVLQIAPTELRPRLSRLHPYRLRCFFELTCIEINHQIINAKERVSDELRFERASEAPLPDASLDTPEGE